MQWLRASLGGVRWIFAGFVALLIYGVVGYTLLDYSVPAAVYNTILVVTTVGFTPPHPLGTVERIFTASIALFGVVTFLAALALFSTALAEGRVTLLSRRRRMDRRIGLLSDHYIICAYGRVGRAVAREFEAEGTPFVVVDRLEDLEPQMQADGVVHLIGDPTSEKILRAVGIDRARGLISAVDSDADNVYITLTSRSLNPDVFIVARASESAAADRLYRAGADRVISPYVSSGRHMAVLASRPRLTDYLEVAGESLRLEETVVEPGSPMIGKEVAVAAGGAPALVVRRAAGEIVANPPGDLVLGAGDLVLTLGLPARPQAKKKAAGRRRPRTVTP